MKNPPLCPICKTTIQMIRPGFSQCKWIIKAGKGDDKRELIFGSFHNKNGYLSYDYQTRKEKFNSLIIQASPLNRSLKQFI
jgi:hypothetical protein